MHRTGFINAIGGRGVGPQGLKPAFLADPSGTAEAVPSPEPIYETSSRSFASLKMTAYIYVANFIYVANLRDMTLTGCGKALRYSKPDFFRSLLEKIYWSRQRSFSGSGLDAVPEFCEMPCRKFKPGWRNWQTRWS